MFRLAELLQSAASQHPQVLLGGDVEEFSEFAYDSRNVLGGEMFVALRTPNGDGHNWTEDAVSRGARGCLVERRPDWLDDEPLAAGVTVVGVADVRLAMAELARHRLRRARLVLVGGSLGKSTVQAALGLALGPAGFGPPFACGDRNDSFGLPIAVSSAPPATSSYLAEVVAVGPKELEELGALLRPQVLCLTTTADADRLYWSCARELEESLSRLCTSETRLALPSGQLEGQFDSWGRVTYGSVGSGAQVRVACVQSDTTWTGLTKVEVALAGLRESVAVRMPPTLALLAVGATAATLSALELDPRPGLLALEGMETPPGRLRKFAARPRGSLLDDSIDSSPASLRLALDCLAAMPPPRAAVLGAEAVRDLSAEAAGGLDRLVIRGEEPALEAGSESVAAPTPLEAARAVEDLLDRGGSVLVKGRAAERMERVTRALAGPRAELVRQDPGRRLRAFRSTARPTWVELDIDALARNVDALVAELAPAALMAVVKADAYGHGAVRVARTALAHGAVWLATATVAEALQLRGAGISAPCLVLGYTPPNQVEVAVASDLTITAFDQEVLSALERAAVGLGGTGRAHLKVDTGMSRLGVSPAAVAQFARLTRDFPHVEVEGIYTHLRRGEDRASTLEQLARFEQARSAAAAAGCRFRWAHAANSAAWKVVPEARYDLVRSGGEVLGLRTADGRRREPVLSFKSSVVQVRWIDPGTYVGYGEAFRASQPMRIATIPVGYGDGFRRGPANWGEVLIRGAAHPLVGDVCMDLAMVDVTADSRIGVGDPVVLIGRQNDLEISAESVAARTGTINYEVVTQLLARVPRELSD